MGKELFADKGYVVFPAAVPVELCNRVITDIEDHYGNNGRIAETAYGMLELYHAQSMWDVRQHPEVHACFAKVLDTDELWVSIDRVCRKVGGARWDTGGGFIHWDMCINQRPRPFEVQGLVALRDTDERMGGFQCVPALYRQLDDWLASLATGKAVHSYLAVQHGDDWAFEIIPDGWGPYYRRIPRRWPIEKVPLKQGDLLIWDSFLPHGNGVNLATETRYCQYVTMQLVGGERERQERIACWRGNLPPSGWAFPGDPRCLEQQKMAVTLTELGRRLLGLDHWG